jgi:hypothetical protein
MSTKLVEQTANAFEFVHKLHEEISFLIKDVQGLLESEEEKFLIGKPSGYAVTARVSTGLESNNVRLWIPKAFTVFFAPQKNMTSSKGATKTTINKDLGVIVLHIEVSGNHSVEPRVLIGHIGNIKSKKTQWNKFENLMWEFAYNREKIFGKLPNVDFEDGSCIFKGEFIERELYSINNSDDIKKQLVDPALSLFRGAK